MKAMIRQTYIGNVKSVAFWIFNLMLPIMWVLIYGLAISLSFKGHDKGEVVAALVPSVLLMSSLTTGYMTLAINLAQMKHTRQFKQISLANITTSRYILAQYLVNITFAIGITLVQALLFGVAFHINWDMDIILTFIFLPIISFSVGFMFGILIASIGSSQRINQFFVMGMFYVIMFSSGSLHLWPTYSMVSQIVPMISPWGCMNELMSYTIGIDAPGFSHIWWSVPIGVAEIAAITVCGFKFFKWV